MEHGNEATNEVAVLLISHPHSITNVRLTSEAWGSRVACPDGEMSSLVVRTERRVRVYGEATSGVLSTLTAMDISVTLAPCVVCVCV